MTGLFPNPVSWLSRAGSNPSSADYRQIIGAVQNEVIPYDKNYFRSDHQLRSSLEVLDDMRSEIRLSLRGDGVGTIKAREAAATVATARWMYRSALVRTETRGMHKRDDFPKLDPNQHHRILSGGLDEVWTAYELDVEPLDRLAAATASRGAA